MSGSLMQFVTIRQSALLAAEYLRHTDNIEIQWYTADSNCSPDKSQAAAKTLIDKGVHVRRRGCAQCIWIFIDDSHNDAYV